MTNRFKNLCISVILFPLLTGCITNHYAQNYTSSEILSERKQTPPNENCEQVVLRLSVASTDEDAEAEFKDFIEDGYVFIGSSVFSAPHCPWSCAIDQAKKIKANLVLLRKDFLRSETRTGITFVPSTSYSYSNGSINTFSYGNVYSNNNTYSYSGTANTTYSRTTSTTTMNAVPYSYDVDIFKQQAIFFKKKKPEKSFYGVLIDAPKFLPGDKASDPVKVTVWAVLKNSRAERERVYGEEMLSKA